MLAGDEILDHAAAQRSRTIQRDEGDDVLQAFWLQVLEHGAQAAAFELEDASCVAGREHLIGFRIVVRNGVEINLDAVADSMVLLTTVRVRRPRKSILSKPMASTSSLGYWVMTASSLVRCSGR